MDNKPMEPVQSVASRALKMIASHAFPQGTTAYCPKCKASRHATTNEIAEWMAIGFPDCKCGGKVTIETPRDKP